MPRIARDYSKIKVYHIIIRGIDKQDIFFDEDDKHKFIDIVKGTKEKYNYEIYFYCLMNNHIHLVIYDKEEQLSKIMQSIEVSYAIFFNKKYERVGHLFQNRFLSKKVEDIEYLKMLCRYIHQNPLKAGIAKTEEYKWSSYNEYIGKSKIVNTKILLSIFSIKEFIEFHNIESNNEIYDLIEYEMQEKITDEQLAKYICKLVNIEDVHKILKFNLEERNKILTKIKENKKITSAQISRVVGINRKIVERLC